MESSSAVAVGQKCVESSSAMTAGRAEAHDPSLEKDLVGSLALLEICCRKGKGHYLWAATDILEQGRYYIREGLLLKGEGRVMVCEPYRTIFELNISICILCKREIKMPLALQKLNNVSFVLVVFESLIHSRLSLNLLCNQG